ncbi:hypothetical protein JGB35_24375, partial [Salmonella enterica subsp. enterica serovar Mbandaka]|nr:hypothetical protein [Salmonella enterica subsp. enterica serovar Mbandaka]
YELNDEPSAYGDHGIRIYGIWSPIAEGKICTHAMKWKKVRKAVDVQEAAADQGACAPWQDTAMSALSDISKTVGGLLS